MLAGYFQRLVNMLIVRKQRQIVPYIFGEDSDVIDHLLRHVYQKSVSEVLHKLLNILAINFDDDLVAMIQEKKQKVLAALVDKLTVNGQDYEEYCNVTQILSELLEQKNFFMIIQKRQNLQKLADVAFNTENTRESRETTLALLCKFVQQFRDRVKSNTMNDDSGDMNMNGDDDIVVEENNDDENDEAKKKAND